MSFMARQRAESTSGVMSRFRPIAPKPVPPPPPTDAAELSLRSRTRKRGRPERDLVRAALADKRLRANKLVVPRPLRPVRTTIRVDTGDVTSARLPVCRMTAAQVEAELGRDELPAVVSGAGHRVRRANDAYKALVGQPVCPWLDALPGTGSSRRINGEVLLDVRSFAASAPSSRPRDDFPCSSRISWERGGTRASVAAPCEVMCIDCAEADYLFVWRFDTSRASLFYCPP